MPGSRGGLLVRQTNTVGGAGAAPPRRVSTAGIYIVSDTTTRYVSTAGIYIVHGPNDRRVSTAGIYVVSPDVPADPNTPPVVEIIAPPSGSTFMQGENVSLQATATDVEDGNLSNVVQWSSDKDGPLT